MTTTITPMLVILIIVSALFFKSQLKNTAKYFARRPLTEPEQILYWKLQKALPDHVVLAQVSFSRFLYTKGATRKDNYSKFSSARQKVADYLICDKNFYIIAIVELDDSTHQKEKDKQRDNILKEANLQIIRWKTTHLPNEEEIRKIIIPKKTFSTTLTP